MADSIDKCFPSAAHTRRALLKTSGWATAVGALSPVFAKTEVPDAAAAYDSTTKAAGAGLYESIGVEPLINCRGTFTIITGSQTLPEVKKAMDEAFSDEDDKKEKK